MRVFFLHIRRLFIFLLALQILNLSFDSIEFQPVNNSNIIVSFNDINTAIEFISEVVLQHPDAFPEYANAGKSSQKNSPLQKQQSIKLYFSIYIPREYLTAKSISKNFILGNENYTSSFFGEITPPPPKA